MPCGDIRKDKNASPSPNPSHQGRGAADSSPRVGKVRWGTIQSVIFDVA
jgi:hypothetical protein